MIHAELAAATLCPGCSIVRARRPKTDFCAECCRVMVADWPEDEEPTERALALLVSAI